MVNEGDGSGDSGPLAWFITFSLYGHWFHGDERGSIDRANTTYLTPRFMREPAIQAFEQNLVGLRAPFLSQEMREAVTSAIAVVCETRSWQLHAINARTNHVHVVVSGNEDPERMMMTFKAYATRSLRAERLIAQERRMWARHGSTIAVWNQRELQNTWEYVTNMQDHR